MASETQSSAPDRAGLFLIEQPKDAVRGIELAYGNSITAALSAPVILVAAPWVNAIEGAQEGELWQERTVNCISGFGFGITRGVVGAVLVPTCGAVYTANSLRQGAVESPNCRAGEGSTLKENFDHVTEQPFTALVTNTPPEGMEAGKDYEFFYTKDPGSIWKAFGTSTYNTAKGVIAGATMVVACPIKEAIKGSQESGFVGGVSGFGSGLTSGAVGGLTVAGAGLVTSGLQFGQGFTSPTNIKEGADTFKHVGEVVMRSSKEPAWGLVGLESTPVATPAVQA